MWFKQRVYNVKRSIKHPMHGIKNVFGISVVKNVFGSGVLKILGVRIILNIKDKHIAEFVQNVKEFLFHIIKKVNFVPINVKENLLEIIIMVDIKQVVMGIVIFIFGLKKSLGMRLNAKTIIANTKVLNLNGH
jgi:hypothetical protein